ncbi:hypothetical protein DFP72DRAFT_972262, partial [Ephemerocybe angulata]
MILPRRAGFVGVSDRCQFDNRLNPVDLDDATDAFQTGLQIIPPGHEDLPEWHANLGRALWNRFKRAGSIPDLDEAILSEQKVAHLSSEDHTSLPTRLDNL